MIRQLGAPNIFFTKSVNEIGMVHLLKSLKEKDKNQVISDDDVKAMSKSERTKLIKKYPIEVVHYLDALFRHHITAMKKNMSLGDYHIADYFYHVEFQQRGSTHIHCLFWLLNQDNRGPPKVFVEKTEDPDVTEEGN